MYYDKNCKHLFVSTGKSDLVVIDVSDPTQPDSCNFYGGVSNGIATWGVSSYQNEIYLSYICAFIPFTSTWTGVKILTYTPCSANSIVEKVNNGFSIFPNPAQNSITLNSQRKSVQVDLNSKHPMYEYIKTIDKRNGFMFGLQIFTNHFGQQKALSCLTKRNDRENLIRQFDEAAEEQGNMLWKLYPLAPKDNKV